MNLKSIYIQISFMKMQSQIFKLKKQSEITEMGNYMLNFKIYFCIHLSTHTNHRDTVRDTKFEIIRKNLIYKVFSWFFENSSNYLIILSS